jgi:uncharacterized membrane protein SirB2
MKKILSVLRYIGDGLILLSFIWSLIETGSPRPFKYMPTRYCLGLGVLLLIPFAFYKMWHWNEYEKDNKQNLIFITALIVLIVICATLFG